jgi:hypothetical protein
LKTVVITACDDLWSAIREIPWQPIAGRSDVLIRDFLRVNLDRDWPTVAHNLPPMTNVINARLGEVLAIPTETTGLWSVAEASTPTRLFPERRSLR